MNTLLLSMLGAIAEFERSIILERQREGSALAKAAGKYKGRKSALTDGQADELRARLAGGQSVSDSHVNTASAARRSTLTVGELAFRGCSSVRDPAEPDHR
jgi:DNA invertase Pin-like site-specific DNA recombinase